MVLSRPVMQRIMINNHVWEVPNEPGWEEVIQDAELIRPYLQKCTSAAECRQIVNELRAIFYHHPVSRKYLEINANDADDLLDSIFKWG
jgi:hypothetical protein